MQSISNSPSEINSECGFPSPCTSDCLSPFHPSSWREDCYTSLYNGGVHRAPPSETFEVATVQVPFCFLTVIYNQEIQKQPSQQIKEEPLQPGTHLQRKMQHSGDTDHGETAVVEISHYTSWLFLLFLSMNMLLPFKKSEIILLWVTAMTIKFPVLFFLSSVIPLYFF